MQLTFTIRSPWQWLEILLAMLCNRHFTCWFVCFHKMLSLAVLGYLLLAGAPVVTYVVLIV